MKIEFINCLNCLNYIGKKKNSLNQTCKAFPNDIPDILFSGINKHRKPFPGDNGIQFEPIK